MDTRELDFTSSIDVLSLKIEPFTQRPFSELIKESSDRSIPHILVKLVGKNETPVVYDARYLCKHLFELVISKAGRIVRIKKSTDPISDKKIDDILFFEVSKEYSYTKGIYIGNQKNFLQSCGFRSKIFNRNDPFDSLSINFLFKDKETEKLTGKRPFFMIGISFTILCVILLSCTYTVIHSSKLIDPIKKFLK